MLWEVHDVSTAVSTLDLSESGLGRWDATRLFFDGVLLSNAIHLVNWTGDPIQVLLCESCGTPGCKEGDWIVLRRVLDRIVMLPAFEDWQHDASLTPPRCLTEQGVPMFEGATLLGLYGTCPALPAIEDLEEPTGEELRRMLQYIAPNDFLGRFPEAVRIDSTALAYCSGDMTQSKDALAQLLEGLPEAPRFEPSRVDARRTTFGFYTPDWREWELLIEAAEGLRLSPLPGIVVPSTQHQDQHDE